MAKNNGVLKTYKSYLFRDKDPIIDAYRTLHSGSKSTYKQTHEKSGVSISTLRNWDRGTTKRPQFCTISAAARADGAKGIRFANDGTPKFVD